MPQSESIAKLADALCKAQAMMKPAVKDTDNPFFKSKYADLASVWDAIREPMSKNGLSVAQCPADGTTDGSIYLRTILMHTSGEWIESTLLVKPVKNDPQAVGSCLTYARRYALAAIMGVCTEDDDGEAATRVETPKSEPSRPLPPVKPVVKPEPVNLDTFTWSVGKYKGQPIRSVPTDYLEWFTREYKGHATDHIQPAKDELAYREAAFPTLDLEENQDEPTFDEHGQPF